MVRGGQAGAGAGAARSVYISLSDVNLLIQQVACRCLPVKVSLEQQGALTANAFPICKKL